MTTATEAITVRSALEAHEREQAFRLRYEVYVLEMGVFRDAADHERGLLVDEQDATAELLVAWMGGEAVGACRLNAGARFSFSDAMRQEWQLHRFLDLVGEDRMCLLNRFLVRRDFRGTTVPLEIIAAAVRRAVELQIDLAFIDCEPHLLSMYTMLGFRPYCGTINDQHRNLLVPLVCLTRDRAYLESINSPLLGWGMDRLDPADAAAAPARLLERLDERPPVRRIDSAGDEWASQLAPLTDGAAGGSVLAGLKPDEVAAIVERSHVIDLDPGATLIRAGQTSRNVYIVLDGALEAGTAGRTARAGDVLGEVAFLTGQPRTMAVVAAAEGARVITVSERTLRALMESHSRPAAVLLLNLARTLAHRLADASRTEPSGRPDRRGANAPPPPA